MERNAQSDFIAMIKRMKDADAGPFVVDLLEDMLLGPGEAKGKTTPATDDDTYMVVFSYKDLMVRFCRNDYFSADSMEAQQHRIICNMMGAKSAIVRSNRWEDDEEWQTKNRVVCLMDYVMVSETFEKSANAAIADVALKKIADDMATQLSQE